MKRLILAELIRYLRDKPDLKKKLKIAAVLGVLGFIMASAVAVFVGIAGVKYVASLSSNLDVTQHSERLRSKVESIPAITSAGCLTAAQGLLNVERLLTTPIYENFKNLKQACIQQTSEVPEEARKESELI
jgi:hypothetical protein